MLYRCTYIFMLEICNCVLGKTFIHAYTEVYVLGNFIFHVFVCGKYFHPLNKWNDSYDIVANERMRINIYMYNVYDICLTVTVRVPPLLEKWKWKRKFPNEAVVVVCWWLWRYTIVLVLESFSCCCHEVFSSNQMILSTYHFGSPQIATLRQVVHCIFHFFSSLLQFSMMTSCFI